MKGTMELACGAAAWLLAAALGARQTPIPTVRPGPEHDLLEKDVGTWDATVELVVPGGPPETSTGVETNRLLGGLWLLTDFKSRMMSYFSLMIRP